MRVWPVSCILLVAWISKVSGVGLLWVRVVNYENAGHRLLNGSCCEPSENVKTCNQPCFVQLQVCSTVGCGVTLLDKPQSVWLPIQGEPKYLVELWHKSQNSSGINFGGQVKGLIAQFLPELQLFPNTNWTAFHFQNQQVILDLQMKVQCEEQTELPNCKNLCKDCTPQSRMFFSGNLFNSFNGFQNMFGNFVSRFSGFSNRISNIVSLLDVMRRILTYMF